MKLSCLIPKGNQQLHLNQLLLLLILTKKLRINEIVVIREVVHKVRFK